MRMIGTWPLAGALATLLSACESADVGRLVDAPCARPEQPPASVVNYKPASSSYQDRWDALLRQELNSLGMQTEKQP